MINATIINKVFLKIEKCNAPIKKQINNIKIVLINMPDFCEFDNDFEKGNALYPMVTIRYIITS